MKSLLYSLIFLMVVSVHAQGRRGNPGWGRSSAYVQMYDPHSVVLAKGSIASIETFIPSTGMSTGLHMVIKTQDGKLNIHLGPSWFLENQEIVLNVGDDVTVEGSRVAFGKDSVIIAGRVTRGEDVLVLRDSGGLPAWNGWRRNNR